jgi:hypothetical protein
VRCVSVIDRCNELRGKVERREERSVGQDGYLLESRAKPGSTFAAQTNQEPALSL